MGFMLNEAGFDRFMAGLSESFLILGPVTQPGSGRFSDTDVVGYGPVTKLADLVLDEKSYFSPKEAVFPPRETLFHFSPGQILETVPPERDVIIFARPCDINGVHRLDRIFLENGPYADPYYKRRRDRVRFFMIECTEGFDSCWCVSMGSNRSEDWDLAFRFEGDQVRVQGSDDRWTRQLEALGVPADFEVLYPERNRVQVTVPPLESVTKELFDHPVWKEYTQRCIHCGRCNTSCVTCSCFTMQDITYDTAGQLGERRRRWAGCHVDGFTDMAGGHSFRKKDGERMRFKAMHKINDYHRRFGDHMCVGCGRCDDVCPEYISFAKCINKLNAIVEEGDDV